MLAVWARFVWTMQRPLARIKHASILRGLLLFALPALAFALAYATLLFDDVAQLSNVALDSTRLELLGSALFLSVVTMTSLTGRVIAQPGWPYVVFALNSLFHFAFVVYAMVAVITLVERRRVAARKPAPPPRAPSPAKPTAQDVRACVRRVAAVALPGRRSAYNRVSNV